MKSTPKTPVLAAIVGGLLLLGSNAALAAGNTGSTFLRQAIRGDIAEIKIGQLAQQKSSNADVKNFGQMLVTDHSKAKNDATTLATTMNVKVPTTPPKKAEALYDRLSKLSGTAFDQAFIKAMIADHKEDISKFQDEAKSGDGKVADLAQQTLPTLQKHLDTAQSLQSKVAQ